jgi:hypothetical protein
MPSLQTATEQSGVVIVEQSTVQGPGLPPVPPVPPVLPPVPPTPPPPVEEEEDDDVVLPSSSKETSPAAQPEPTLEASDTNKADTARVAVLGRSKLDIPP